MSNTTPSAVTETTTTISSLDLYLSLIQIPSITTQFYLWGYLITFLLGFTGNTLSLLTFSRSTLRNISTGCLFIILAISDTLYLFISIIDFAEFGLKVRFYHRVDYDQLCRFRMFTICVSQVYSAWLLVIITSDRWIRTRFPFKSNSICTRKNALLLASIVLIVVIGLHSHILLPFFGMVLPGIPSLACGANGNNAEYVTFYYYQWTIIQIITTSFGPAVLMIIMVMDISIKIRAQKKLVASHLEPINGHRSARSDKRIHNQMILLMLSTIAIFFITTLPITIDDLVAVHTVTDLSDLSNLFIIRTILNWLQSLNCAVNFYVYCLTSTLFRKEFTQLMRIIRGRREVSLHTATQMRTIHVTQPQQQH
ncbi:unnamed protein product [Adineta steineri]|uniref:G-protein coupled receptors family 1 profile domain-containing protein n=1 Tax=Adineta steineri TaxID=433720 RepID=A0A818Q349_9BILA|nr:unnamed protein product [Adineta steineri]